MGAEEQQQKKNAGKLLRYMKAPMRALRRARDFYVNSLTGCAGRSAQYGGVYLSGRPMPRSYSVSGAGAGGPRSSTSDEDYRELLRAVSQGALGSLNRGADGGAVPRSQSVAIGRIDEDSAMDFGKDFKLGVPGPAYPRSRSCAVPGPARWNRVAVVA